MYGVDYQAQVSTRASEWEHEMRTLQLSRAAQADTNGERPDMRMRSTRFAWLTHLSHVVTGARHTRTA